jgi:hypothetical protein
MRPWLLDTGPIVAFLDARDLAKSLKTNSICTLDRRGFRTYRVGRKAFHLVLDD